MNIQYDKWGRIEYNPKIHFNHGRPMSSYDKMYLCKFYDVDGPVSISYALGRTESSLAQIISDMRKNGEYEKYKQMWDQLEGK